MTGADTEIRFQVKPFLKGNSARNMQTAGHFNYSYSASFLIVLFTVTAVGAAPAAMGQAAASPTIHWVQGQPGSTFTRGEDGKYRYGLWSGDLGITVAVDSRELQRARHRLHPFIAILLTYQYKGTKGMEVRNDNLTLEFVNHYHVRQSTLDPEDFSVLYQNVVDALVAEKKEHEVKKHPEKSEEIETTLKAYQEELVEIQEFLCTHALHHSVLDRETPEIKGWIFFNTKSKWIGDWKKREDFVLRIPMDNGVYEFPFIVPPVEGDLILRRRPEKN
jgi:hypothetical protein